MKWLLFSALFCLPSATPARPGHSPSPRSVFARHNDDGRLAHTKITKLGIVRVERAQFSIYYLEFVNPVSHHGMQQIAIIKNGREFAGAYQCTLSPHPFDWTLTIGTDQLTVKVNGDRLRPPLPASLTSVIRFDAKGPTKNKYFCGEGSGWENSI
jgi:hypothetical protein